ncbi:MAG: RMD1 family protein [Lutisporaceae bacterium]
MSKYIKVFSLCNEINLNKLATHFGISKKFKWEEYLTLDNKQLQGIVREPEGKIVKLFYFGSAVFVNMEHHEIVDFVNYMKTIEKGVANASYKYQDDYKIVVNNETPTIHFEYMNVNNYEDYHLNILAVILAKSVALERIEEGLDSLLDEMEEIIMKLEKGKLAISDSKLAKTAANILKYKFNTISYLMLLDKPDITWLNQESEILYNELSKLFELHDRYDKIKAKSETLMDITEVFSTLTHQKRGNILEWMVIILIAIELVVALLDRLF